MIKRASAAKLPNPMRPLIACLTLLAGLISATPRVRADQTGALMRGLVAKHGNGVVTISMVVQGSDASDQRELEASGVIIDPSGLIATTNTAIDPNSLMAMMLGGDSGGSNVVSAKILLPQGGEVPAKVVLRDKDRNLAFLRTQKPLPKPVTFLDFKTSRATAQLGDPVYLMGRLGRAASRKPSIRELRISAALTKPRVLYAIPNDFSLLGQAAFNEQGQLLGLVSMRAIRSRSSSFNDSDQTLTSVVPASDVWEIAAQAPKK